MPSNKTKKKAKTLKSITVKVSKTNKPVKKKTDKNTKTVEKKKLSNVLRLSEKSLLIIVKNWQLFSIIVAIYFFLTLLFVRGFSSTANVVQLKNTYLGKNSAFHADLSVFGNLVGSSLSSSNGSDSIYQSLLFIIFTLVFIWVLRELWKKQKITVRDSFYKSQYAILPLIIVILFLILELIPMLLGLFLYGTIFNNGIAVNIFEKIIWFLVSFAFVGLSLFFLVSSIFAIYIVTLPDVRPMQALRSAWRLVKGRRLTVLRKVLFLPIGLALSVGLISLVFIALVPQVADYVLFVLGSIFILIAHSYLYNLYRELI
jgi:hypothetical protein